MFGELVLTNQQPTSRALMSQLRSQRWSWKLGGAVFGLCCGIVSPFLGSVLTAISWFTGPHWLGLPVQRVGMVLLSLTIPFLIFGAHCLDLVDKQNKS